MELKEKEKQYILQTYKRLPIEVDHADGVYVYAKDGRKYLDFFGGIAVNALGYDNSRVKSAILNQINRYMHMSNLFYMDVQVDLAELICELSGYAKIFFTNSGTEAVEAAIKVSRKWGSKENKSKLLALTNSFHGRTMGALSLTDRPKYRQGFEPFLPDVEHVEFNDVTDLAAKVDSTTAAVFIEFIQGEGGINVASGRFVEQLFALKQKHGFLVVADEIQTGIYRTGKLFSFEYHGVHPDMVTLAKPLGGSLPLGGLLVDPHLVDVLGYGGHGTTFGGNPVSCAAGLATLQELSERRIASHVSKVGGHLKQRLLEFKSRHPQFVSEVRGLGLMLGVECTVDCSEFVSNLLSNGVLVNCTNGNVIRILPPLVIEEAHADNFMSILEETYDAHVSRFNFKEVTA
ncbi:MAG TPA: acetylornithine/succinylornithine family transaminase [Candidatus Acidoferrales bacterium]|nr:acetylornithine/succinylornithine family transaminase [Candidatus Acidoferrales bacterium]